MADVEIWHNPRCSKSREALRLLTGRGVEPKVVEYLKDPPGASRLEEVLRMLDLSPRDLMRTKEEPYRSLGLADPAKATRELVEAMVANPILIERPVIIHGDRAVVGRPPERALEVL